MTEPVGFEGEWGPATPEPDDEPCERCQGFGSIPQGFSWHADSGEPMPGHTNIPCPDCDRRQRVQGA